MGLVLHHVAIGKIRKLPNHGNFFMHITASQLNKNPGKYLHNAMTEPVVIEKMHEPIVVMVSYERYQELEDAYWGELALQAKQEPTLGVKQTKAFLSL